MSAVSLRICATNRERFALPVHAWENLGVEEVACLAQCGDCEAGPFVERNGELIFADSVEELAARLAGPS